MHPYWIQKIEESRKTSVTKFWVTIILIIVIPLLLVLKHDGFLIIGVACFAAAGLRYYWLGREVPAKPRDQLPVSADLAHKAEIPAAPQWQTNTNPNIFGGPHGVPQTHTGVQQHSGAAPHPGGVSANPVPEQIQTGQLTHDQRVTGQFAFGAQQPNGDPTQFTGVPTQFPNGVPTNPFPSSGTPEQLPAPNNLPSLPITDAQFPAAVSGAPIPSVSQKPLHFHDVAR